MGKKTSEDGSKRLRITERSKTVALAKTGRELRHLVWMKLLCSATPEVRKLIIVYARLDAEVRGVLPDTGARPRDHWTLMEQVNAAERLLTGWTDETLAEISAEWHM